MKQIIIENAKKEMKKLINNGNVPKMTINMINDDLKELIEKGKVETCFKSVIEFFRNCGCKVEKKENSIATIISF